jgi:hypothetical protein
MSLKKNILIFKEIDDIIKKFDSFESYHLDTPRQKPNQLFSKENPPLELVENIINHVVNKPLDDFLYYEFTLKQLTNKNIIEKISKYMPELKKYYLKCKSNKYLENLNEKKVITLLRQILRPYNFIINTYEKYNNGEKYLLYILEKKKDLKLKKINSLIIFD